MVCGSMRAFRAVFLAFRAPRVVCWACRLTDVAAFPRKSAGACLMILISFTAQKLEPDVQAHLKGGHGECSRLQSFFEFDRAATPAFLAGRLWRYHSRM